MKGYNSADNRNCMWIAFEFATQFQGTPECQTSLSGSKPLRSDQDVAQGMLQLQFY